MEGFLTNSGIPVYFAFVTMRVYAEADLLVS
jgi:hypothetical protein